MNSLTKKLTLAIILVILILIFVVGCTIYAIEQANKMILQGEVEVKSVDLSSKVTGRVLKKLHDKGDIIKKGEVIVMLDTPEVYAKETQADAMLDLAMAQKLKADNGARKEDIEAIKAKKDLAEKTYNRMNRLYNEGVIPAQKLDEARANYDMLKNLYLKAETGTRVEDKMSASALVKKAKGANAEVNSYLKENKIVSPIDGVITDVTVDEGELVGAGYPIVTVADNSDCWVIFNLREDLLSKFKVGKEFDVTIPAIGKKTIKVRVNYISVMGNFATWRATKARGDFDMKTFELRAVPVEKTDDLRAGMSALFDWKKIK